MKKIDIKKVEKKLDNLILTNEFSKLQDVVIFQDVDGTYKLFNKYSLKKSSTSDVVVSLIKGDDINSFFSIKNAVCWCVLDKLGKYNLANRVIDLDMSLSSVEVHISIHLNLFKKAKKTDDKLIFLAKLNEDKFRRSSMYQELESYVGQSDYWQQHQFKLKTAH